MTQPIRMQIGKTPNERTLKFMPGRAVLGDVVLDCPNMEEARLSSALAASLFKLPSVEGVFLSGDYVAVTLKPGKDWDAKFKMTTRRGEEILPLKGAITHIIKDAFAKNAVIKPDALQRLKAAAAEIAKDPVIARIVAVIDEFRKDVAADGGDMKYVGFSNGVVTVDVKGACSGCSYETSTIQELMRRLQPVSQVKGVKGPTSFTSRDDILSFGPDSSDAASRPAWSENRRESFRESWKSHPLFRGFGGGWKKPFSQPGGV